MISRERVSSPGTAIGRIISEPQWVQCKDYVHLESRDYKNIILTWGRNGFPANRSCLYDQYFRPQGWARFSSLKEYVVSCRFHARLIVFLSVCNFVCHVALSSPWREGMKAWFFHDWNWLRGCTNLCLEGVRPVEVLLLQKWRKKLCFSSPHVRRPEKAFVDQNRHLKPISVAKHLHQVLKPKKIGNTDATEFAKFRYEHTGNTFRNCPSRFFTSDDDLQGVLYSTLYSGRFQSNFLRITTESRYDTVPYLCAWYHVQERIVPDHGSATGPCRGMELDRRVHCTTK